MSIDITLLGTGSPIPDPNRAGPATMVSAVGEHYLVDPVTTDGATVAKGT